MADAYQNELKLDLAGANAKIEQLTAALNTYACHKTGCDTLTYNRPCTCGLAVTLGMSAALTTAKLGKEP